MMYTDEKRAGRGGGQHLPARSSYETGVLFCAGQDAKAGAWASEQIASDTYRSDSDRTQFKSTLYHDTGCPNFPIAQFDDVCMFHRAAAAEAA